MATTPVTQFDYKIQVCSFGTETILAEITDFIGQPTYTKRLWQPGYLTFSLPAGHPAIALLTLNVMVEVWRRNLSAGVAWYRDFVGIFRGREWAGQGNDVFTAKVPGAMTMLSWRQVGYPAGTANKNSFTGVKGETIMKNLVSTNFGATATIGNGRFRNGNTSAVTTYLTVAADQGRGNLMDWSCANKNVLEELQALALVAGGDFDLIYNGSGWTFEFYPGQLGTDRSATVIFSLDYDNMMSPYYNFDQTDEKTVGIVGGQGQGSQRNYVTRTGANFDATNNDIEVFIDGSIATTTTTLNNIGDQALNALKSRSEFHFLPLQTPTYLYGRDYFLGDLVTANYTTHVGNYTVYNGIEQIFGATIGLGVDGLEALNFELRQQ